MVMPPTRTTYRKAALIDHVLANSGQLGVVDLGLSDHDLHTKNIKTKIS